VYNRVGWIDLLDSLEKQAVNLIGTTTVAVKESSM
jgi:hypothetical protein